jgi:hypothetical protein
MKVAFPPARLGGDAIAGQGEGERENKEVFHLGHERV